MASSPSPRIARELVAKYKPRRTAPIGRALERGLVCVAGVDAYLAVHPDPAGDPASQSGLRNALFRLEAWLRLYRKAAGKPFEKALERVKELEDVLGAVSMWRDMTALAKRVRLPTPARKKLDRSARRDGERLARIAARRWVPDAAGRGQSKAIDRVIGHLLDADLADGAEDIEYLRKRMAKHVKKILEKEWDFSSLQGGIHELRRRLRWLPLYFQSLDGAVQLSDAVNPVPALAKLLREPEASSAFIAMAPPGRDAEPIVVSKSLVVANSRMIDALGEIKDAGEQVEYLAQAVEEAKIAKGPDAIARVRAQLGPGHGEDDVEGATERAWAAFTVQGALAALHDELLP